MTSLSARVVLAFIGIVVLTTVLTGAFADYVGRREFAAYIAQHPGEPFPVPPGTQQSGRLGPPPPPPALRRALWEATAIVALFGVAVALWLARGIVKPVTDLTGAAETLSRGMAVPPLLARNRDEIGVLSETFNRMTAYLAAESARRTAAEEQRRRLLAGIAHELRSPLFVIQGTVEGMLDGVIETGPENLTTIHRHAMLLRRLITDLRDLSLAETGHLALHRQSTNLRQLVHDVAHTLAQAAADRGASLSEDTPAEVPTVDGDPDRLRQILHNLIENAILHTPSGGRILIRLRADGDWIHLSVSDTGSGIAADDVPHIFDHFYRGDPARARRTGGSGLGLAMVKSLVEAHGGHVAVDSTVGLGSTFSVTLPRHAPNDASRS
jgi:signal transduction histidine kinase